MSHKRYWEESHKFGPLAPHVTSAAPHHYSQLCFDTCKTNILLYGHCSVIYRCLALSIEIYQLKANENKNASETPKNIEWNTRSLDQQRVEYINESLSRNETQISNERQQKCTWNTQKYEMNTGSIDQQREEYINESLTGNKTQISNKSKHRRASRVNWPGKRGIYQWKSKCNQNTNIKWKATKMQVKHRGASRVNWPGERGTQQFLHSISWIWSVAQPTTYIRAPSDCDR